jgi:hypothetical protein
MERANNLRKIFRRAAKDTPARAPMVGWYDPGQLVVTALRAVLSDVFATRADYRVVQALRDRLATLEHSGGGEPLPSYDWRDELWIDYVADTGDGFCSTFAIASRLGQREITVKGAPEPLPRGDVLILGGDQVYPTPTPETYRDRFVRPYEIAFPGGDGGRRPDMYAIPGNHDWYDGLRSFTDIFCFRSRLGGWCTPQSRSYFALKLRKNVWLLGVDVQLESDIDQLQKDYFCNLDIVKDDLVILCTPEPDWIYKKIFTGATRLGALEALLVKKGARIVMKIAGDQHHYRRHTLVRGGREQDCHLITAGGGGAFLHPTHTHDVQTIHTAESDGDAVYKLAKEYPDRPTSRRLGLYNAFFLFINPKFGLVTAVVYMILSWVMPVPRSDADFPSTMIGLARSAVDGIATSPSSVVWMLAVLAVVVSFTDAQHPAYRWLGGLTHGISHLCAAMAISAFSMRTIYPAGYPPGQEMPTAYDRLLLSLAELAGGYVAGALIMGLYLLISVVLFSMHGNEAFSSLRISGYKNFLRMRLTDQELTVWAIGIERVPQSGDWEWEDGRWNFVGREAIECKLIDAPLHIPMRAP